MNIGVYGSAAGDTGGIIDDLAWSIGAEVARQGHTVVTGACNGVPQAAVLGAQAVGGKAIGFSTAQDEEQHIQEGNPVDGLTELRYIPVDYEHKDDLEVCRKYRNVSSVAFADAAIFINGRMGTLNEFTNAYDIGRHIGVLKGSGGVSDDIIPVLLEKVNKPNGATVVFESDPATLVAKLIENYSCR